VSRRRKSAPSKAGAFSTAGGAVLDFWFAPLPAERLALFQRAFTFTFGLFMLGWARHGAEWLTTAGYHISREATERVYPTPAPPLPEAWLVPFLVLLFGASLAGVLTAGRIVRIVLLGLAVYVQLVDQPAAFTLNKLYVVFFFFLAIAPSPRFFTGEGGTPAAFVSAWPVRMIQATLLIQYFTAGICKVAWGDWLQRSDILFTHAVGLYRTEAAALFIHHMPAFGWVALGWSALLFELLAPVLFIVRRLRPVAFVWGVGFHLAVALMMKDLIYFSLQLISVYVLFIPAALAVDVERRIRALTARARSALAR
jgi:hypothetical protein